MRWVILFKKRLLSLVIIKSGVISSCLLISKICLRCEKINRPQGGLGNCSLHCPHKSHPWLDRTRAAPRQLLHALPYLPTSLWACPTFQSLPAFKLFKQRHIIQSRLFRTFSFGNGTNHSNGVHTGSFHFGKTLSMNPPYGHHGDIWQMCTPIL